MEGRTLPETTLDRKLESWRGILGVTPAGEVVVGDPKRLREGAMDDLVRLAVFGLSEQDKQRARVLIWEAGRQTGVRPWSIQTLYEAMGRSEVSGFTTPAI